MEETESERREGADSVIQGVFYRRDSDTYVTDDACIEALCRKSGIEYPIKGGR